MRKIFENIDHIAEECENAAVMFSGGRDSIVMLDLFAQRARKSIGRVIHMHMVPGLEFQEKVLRYYERRYKITIERRAHPLVASALPLRPGEKRGRKLRIADFEKAIREEGVSWIAWGYRKDESLQRRGQLSNAQYGIYHQYRKLFPVAEWSARHMDAYMKRERLILPPDYKEGWRDITTFKGEALIYVYRNYPEDFEKIAHMYPDTRGELMRAIDEEATGGR